MSLPHALTAWGREGHQVVASIAQARLSPAARSGVYQLLHGATLASVATDADDYRNSHRETARWHYVDIPLQATRYDAARDCRVQDGEGDCALAEIDRLVATLRNRQAPAVDRAQALKFLVHFIGDIHCPLHASDDHDKGGNQVGVTLVNQATNLHAVWDSGLIQLAGYTVTSLTRELERANLPVPAGGTPTGWVMEAHEVARAVAYRMPSDRVLRHDYQEASLAAVRLQVWRGGVRLARVLNELFEGQAAVINAPGASPAATQTPKVTPTLAPMVTQAQTSMLTPGGAYHGNVASKVYHAPSCRDYQCPNCTTSFVTKDDASKAGYRPHNACVR